MGRFVLGMGFTFDDDDRRRDAARRDGAPHREGPPNNERIFPYIGGEEVNDSPTHTHRRYVINFGEMTEGEARRWPDLMAIVEAKVKPQRLQDKRAAYRKYWWKYAEKRADLYPAIRGLDRVLVNCQVGPHLGFAFQPPDRVFAHTLTSLHCQRWRPGSFSSPVHTRRGRGSLARQ